MRYEIPRKSPNCVSFWMPLVYLSRSLFNGCGMPVGNAYPSGHRTSSNTWIVHVSRVFRVLDPGSCLQGQGHSAFTKPMSGSLLLTSNFDQDDFHKGIVHETRIYHDLDLMSYLRDERLQKHHDKNSKSAPWLFTVMLDLDNI